MTDTISETGDAEHGLAHIPLTLLVLVAYYAAKGVKWGGINAGIAWVIGASMPAWFAVGFAVGIILELADARYL